MATILVSHGAWSAGWVWKKMHPRLRAMGHVLFTPTYTGVGERVHLAHPDITLDTHIRDILNVVEFEDLSDLVLVGHSYGGMVATGVADRIPGKVRRLVYLDAFAPRDGQALFDLVSLEARTAMRAAAVDGWRLVPNPPPADTPKEDLDWITPRRVHQPIKTFEQPIKLSGAVERLTRSYIYCRTPSPGDPFRQFAERARAEGWQSLEIDSSHNPHVTAPDVLAAMLDAIAR
jgi:pimeloyl-ACP methyl ester carboxylesterase